MKTNIDLSTDHGRYRISVDDKVDDTGVKYLNLPGDMVKHIHLKLAGIAPEQVSRLSQIAMLSSLLLSLLKDYPAAANSEDEAAGRLSESLAKGHTASFDFRWEGSDRHNAHPGPAPDAHPLDDNEWMELYALKYERESLVRLLEKYGQNPDDMILAKVAWLIKNQRNPSGPVQEEHLFNGMDIGASVTRVKMEMLNRLLADYNLNDGSVYDRVELLLQKDSQAQKPEDSKGDGCNESS